VKHAVTVSIALSIMFTTESFQVLFQREATDHVITGTMMTRSAATELCFVTYRALSASVDLA
jgi:hypothetical protein